MLTFARHYIEMLIAMSLGMAVLGLAWVGAASLGYSSGDLRDDAPAVSLLLMAIAMTVPMVAWMRHRGHGWAASNEMAASMFLPTFAAIGLLASGALTDFSTLMAVEHVAMLPAMLGVMLLRYDEYAGAVHAH